MSIAGLAEAWENCAMIRGRFRKGLPWLQFPIPKAAPSTPKDSKDGKPKARDPHTPTTRALELNHEILDKMLDFCSMEFLEIGKLEKEAF